MTKGLKNFIINFLHIVIKMIQKILNKLSVNLRKIIENLIKIGKQFHKFNLYNNKFATNLRNICSNFYSWYMHKVLTFVKNPTRSPFKLSLSHSNIN